MDSRAATAYGEPAILDYLDFMQQRPDWEEKMADRGVDALMIGNRSKFVENYAQGHLQGRWKLVFAGKNASVYIARP